MSIKSKSLYLLLAGILFLQACNVNSSFETETIHLGALWPKAEMKIRGGVADSRGNIYVMDENGILHAVNSKGKERWNYQGDYEQASPPIFDEDTKTVYFITDTNSLFAVNQSGKKKWSFKGDSAIVSYPKLAPDGSIYLLATGKNRYGFGSRIFHVFSDGTHETFDLDEYYDLDQSAIGSDGTLYLWDWEAFTVFSPTGEKLKQCKSGDIGRIKSDLVTGPDGTVLLAIDGGTVVAIKPDCSTYWQSYVTANKEFDFKYNIIYDQKQTVFIGGPEGTLHALDAKSGQHLWKSEENANIGEFVSVVMLDDGLFYAISSRAKFIAFDSQGKKKWKEELFYPGAPVAFQRLSGDDIFLFNSTSLMIELATMLIIAPGTPCPVQSTAAITTTSSEAPVEGVVFTPAHQ